MSFNLKLYLNPIAPFFPENGRYLSKHTTACMFKNSTFHIPRFLIVFAVLSVGFYGYVGIVSPGGKGYSPFLDQYANIPDWATYFISKSAKGILTLLGYEVFQRRPDNITIAGSKGVTILWACLGFGVMSCWVAFVTAHKAAATFKGKWVAIGLSLITLLNIVRIAMIALANHHHWTAFQALDPHQTFNIASYVLILGLMGWFVVRYKQNNSVNTNYSQTSGVVLN